MWLMSYGVVRRVRTLLVTIRGRLSFRRSVGLEELAEELDVDLSDL